MARDAFLSYARSDGKEDVEEIQRILGEHDVTTYVDTYDPSRPGEDITRDIEQWVRESRVFVAVVTNDYEDSTWTKLEYEIAQQEHKRVVPVILGTRESIGWLKSPKWFDGRRKFIAFGTKSRDQSDAIWELIEAMAPAQMIIETAEAIAGKSLTEAIGKIDELLDELSVSGFPRVQVLAHRAQLLRLAGKRSEAMSTLDSLSLIPKYPYHVVQKALVTAAAVLIDGGDFVEARARLSEAAAVLARETTWKSDDRMRRKLLAEVTREMARSYLEETYKLAVGNPDTDPLGCFQLEIAWAVYMEALAQVREEEDILGHAWIHDNLGNLAAQYARRSRKLARYDVHEPITGLDYPAITRFRGSLDNLVQKSRYHLDFALQLFRRIKDKVKRREGEAWTRYHRAQTDLLAANYSEASSRSALDELQKVALLFAGIAEGEGLTFAEMFYIAQGVGETAAARKYGARAIHLLKESEKHERVVSDIQQQLYV